MNKKTKDNGKRISRMIYLTLTLLAVVVLVATISTFFSASRRMKTDKIPDSAETTQKNEVTTAAPETTKQPEETKAPVKKSSPVKNPETQPLPDEKDKPSGEVREDDPLPVIEEPEDKTSEVAGIPLGERELIVPVYGRVTKKHDLLAPVFSLTMNDYRVHHGIDVEAHIGDGVFACADGRITEIVNDPFMGTCLTLDLGGGLTACYKNLSADLPEYITVGTDVISGQVIAAVGETAAVEIAESPHLHFELIADGVQIDPLSLISFADIPADYQD